jgi:hypothetical protein
MLKSGQPQEVLAFCKAMSYVILLEQSRAKPMLKENEPPKEKAHSKASRKWRNHEIRKKLIEGGKSQSWVTRTNRQR